LLDCSSAASDVGAPPGRSSFADGRDLQPATSVIRIAIGVARHGPNLVGNTMTIGNRTTVKAVS